MCVEDDEEERKKLILGSITWIFFSLFPILWIQQHTKQKWLDRQQNTTTTTTTSTADEHDNNNNNEK